MICTDPDATESSSDDEERTAPKRLVHEICLPAVEVSFWGCESAEDRSSSFPAEIFLKSSMRQLLSHRSKTLRRKKSAQQLTEEESAAGRWHGTCSQKRYSPRNRKNARRTSRGQYKEDRQRRRSNWAAEIREEIQHSVGIRNVPAQSSDETSSSSSKQFLLQNLGMEKDASAPISASNLTNSVHSALHEPSQSPAKMSGIAPSAIAEEFPFFLADFAQLFNIADAESPDTQTITLDTFDLLEDDTDFTDMDFDFNSEALTWMNASEIYGF